MEIRRFPLVAAAGLLMALSIACGGGARSAAVPPTPTPETRGIGQERAGLTRQEVTKPTAQGGVLNLRKQREMVDFDPHYSISTNDIQNNMNFYSTLVRQQDRNPIQGDLAERWEVSPDGLKYTFYLRRNVKFHDGVSVTSRDVVYSLNRMMGRSEPEKRKSGRTGILDGYVKAVTAKDEYTVEMELHRAAVVLLELITNGHASIIPAGAVAADLKRVPKGSGPWMLDEWVQGSHLLYKRNPSYYGAEGPYLDAIKHWFIRDEAAYEAAFFTKKVDVGACLSLDCYQRTDQMEARGELLKQRAISYGIAGMGINMRPDQKGPWTDKRVRRAMQLVYDQQGNIATIMDGRGIITGILSSGTPWGRPPEFWQTKPGYRIPKDPDIAEAKKLMAEAGFANGFEMEMQVRNDQPDRAREAELWANQLALIGVKPKIILRDSADIFERGETGRYEVWQHSWAFFTTDPDELLGIHFLKDAPRNYFGYDRPDWNSLFQQMSKEQDLKKRMEMVQKLEDMVWEDLPVIPIPQTVSATMWWSYVKNWNPGWNSYVDSRKDLVWIDASQKR
ncbi:MAG: ABC transporter substrate-binding protein [Chloroflexi bacterium]|nr:ABC transporter substrate-binding protein [Chloroflexota bacterium]